MLIDIKDLVKKYVMGQNEVAALKGINIGIKKNEFVSIMGPSGSGKSTLMNILGCLDNPTEGHYYLDSLDVSNMDDDELSFVRNKKIGFIFQTFNLLPKISSLHNVELPLVYARMDKKLRREMAEQALEKVGLKDRMLHRPNELSGGQRQRVAIARALVNDPELILADEPTGNLDTKTGYEIMEIFNLLHGNGNSIVLITHEPDIAEYSQRIITLKDGLVLTDEQNEPKKVNA